jgi:hypothetical protein
MKNTACAGALPLMEILLPVDKPKAPLVTHCLSLQLEFRVSGMAKAHESCFVKLIGHQ